MKKIRKVINGPIVSFLMITIVVLSIFHRISGQDSFESERTETKSVYDNKDYTKPAKFYRKTLDQGVADAQVKLGFMYAEGEGVKQDYIKAEKLWQKAADQGQTGAQYNLGVMYANGKGVKQDYIKAAKFYQQAADQGRKEAQYNLGGMYHEGQGIKQDYMKAIKLWQEAADQGYAAAQYNLGTMYTKGQGVKQDYFKAAKYYQQAVDQGYAAAQYGLGVMYDKGQGVRQNLTIAKELFGKACGGGLNKGCKFYADLNQHDSTPESSYNKGENNRVYETEDPEKLKESTQLPDSYEVKIAAPVATVDGLFRVVNFNNTDLKNKQLTKRLKEKGTTVEDYCHVKEVDKAGIFRTGYKVDCKLSGSRVLSLYTQNENVINIARGQTIQFKGTIRSLDAMNDWANLQSLDVDITDWR